MQNDLDASRPDLEIELLGVNEHGYGGDSITNLVDLPWMKDDAVITSGSSLITVKDSFNASHRDVVILNDQNEIVTSYNLTSNDIRVTANYDQLKQLLIDIAEGNYP